MSAFSDISLTSGAYTPEMRTTSMFALAIVCSIAAGAHAGQGNPSSRANSTPASPTLFIPGAEDPVMQEAARAEQAQMQALASRERAEIEAAAADKKKSEADKKIAVKKIKKSYLDQRNAIRLKARYELRAKLLHDPGPSMLSNQEKRKS